MDRTGPGHHSNDSSQMRFSYMWSGIAKGSGASFPLLCCSHRARIHQCIVREGTKYIVTPKNTMLYSAWYVRTSSVMGLSVHTYPTGKRCSHNIGMSSANSTACYLFELKEISRRGFGLGTIASDLKSPDSICIVSMLIYTE